MLNVADLTCQWAGPNHSCHLVNGITVTGTVSVHGVNHSWTLKALRVDHSWFLSWVQIEINKVFGLEASCYYKCIDLKLMSTKNVIDHALLRTMFCFCVNLSCFSNPAEHHWLVFLFNSATFPVNCFFMPSCYQHWLVANSDCDTLAGINK